MSTSERLSTSYATKTRPSKLSYFVTILTRTNEIIQHIIQLPHTHTHKRQISRPYAKKSPHQFQSSAPAPFECVPKGYYNTNLIKTESLLIIIIYLKNISQNKHVEGCVMHILQMYIWGRLVMSITLTYKNQMLKTTWQFLF